MMHSPPSPADALLITAGDKDACAGGGFRHGQHLIFDKKNNYPLANLYVSMLQRIGVETEQFASRTGTMRGLNFRASA